MQSFIEIVRYRTMIFQLVRRDLSVRYRNSALGFLWTFFQPLFQLVIYTVVFSVILRSGTEQYSLFLFTGLVPWLFFSTSLTGGSTCVLAMQDLVKKVWFPRRVLPLSYVAARFIHLLLVMPVVLTALVLAGRIPGLPALTLLPVYLLEESILALGCALILSSVTVYFRDVEQFTSLLLMGWQFLTPVMYPREQVPESVRWVMDLNPLAPLITGIREILFYRRVPPAGLLVYPGLAGAVILTAGWILFGKLEGYFAENL